MQGEITSLLFVGVISRNGVYMAIEEKEIIYERKKLQEVNEELRKKISNIGQDMFDKEEKLTEFRKFTWDNKSDFDPTEMKMLLTGDNKEAYEMMEKGKYFKKLMHIQKSPYFASIIFQDEENKKYEIYISLTYLTDQNNDNILYDWRSPICSLFYDYEVGPCSYMAPKEAIIKGDLLRKRQYKIVNGELKNLFDNSLNINDDLLQEVLANESSEKMKNIVNTIQQEQNQVIRNVEDDTLIVQGIAGSGKTSVALHRIAFLLYKIKNLTSNNVLIFSPNQIFTEYISNVLPELGEENTLQTTFHEYLSKSIKEYKKVESFIEFISRYYKGEELNPELVKYKQSINITNDIKNFVNDLLNKVDFKTGFIENHINEYTKDELNDLFKNRYSKLPLMARIEEMATKMSYSNYRGSRGKISTYKRLIKEALRFNENYRMIYVEFLKSKYCQIKSTDNEIKNILDNKYLKYEDALLFVYLKGLLEGFGYENNILQIVIDEAQDYSPIQYEIIANIFKRAKITILGDINQTINPYYKYDNLNILGKIFSGFDKYIELTKTYRSSAEIIAYTNEILGLNHVSAIRKENQKPVAYVDGINNLSTAITNAQKEYKSIAIITKDNNYANVVYNKLKNQFKVKLINNEKDNFSKELVILPTYLAKGLEFDVVIVINNKDSNFNKSEKYLLYVACTRAQHQLIICK